jgi:hypothetical protein
MKNIILLTSMIATILLTMSQGVLAADVKESTWVSILEEEAVSSYIDTSNVDATGRAAIFFVKQVFREMQVMTVNGKSIRYKTSIAMYAADCSKREAIMPRVVFGEGDQEGDQITTDLKVEIDENTPDITIKIDANPVLTAGLKYYCKAS